MPAGSRCPSVTSRLLSPGTIARPGLSAGRADRSRREQAKTAYPERARCMPPGPALRSVAARPGGQQRPGKNVAGPARAERLEVPRSPSRATARAARPMRPCPASPAPAPRPPPAARLPLWRRTCGALPQRTQELLTGQATVARLRAAFRDLGRRTGLAVPPTVAAIVNSPLSFVSGTRRTPIRSNRKTDSARRRVNAYQPVLSLAPSCRRRIAAINHEDFQEVLSFARRRRHGLGAERHRGNVFHSAFPGGPHE